jgi:hypothetical protein
VVVLVIVRVGVQAVVRVSNLGASTMTNFLGKLMFWRKSPDGEASRPAEDTSLTPEELEYQAEREEQLIQEEREQDDIAP